MGTETIWLRAAYPVLARLPRRRTGWHAVSEAVAVEVPVLSADENPVALRVTRPMTIRTRWDAERWDRVTGTGRRVEGQRQQPFDVRMGPSGLLAPVLGPDGTKPVDAATLPDLTRRVMADRDRRTLLTRDGVAWASYPGARPSSEVDPAFRTGAWPDVTPTRTNRPTWDCPDIGEAGFSDVDADVRERALVDFRARVAGLVIVDGRLWRSCGTPVVATDLGERPYTRLLVPGMDAAPGEAPLEGVPLFVVDHRSPLPAGARTAQAGFAVEALLDVPRADVSATNLLLVGRSTRVILGGTPYGSIPEYATDLLAWMDRLGGRVRSGHDLQDLEAGTSRLVRETVAEMGCTPVTSLHDSVPTCLERLTAWGAVVAAEREAVRVAEAERDPGEELASLSM